MKAHTFKIFIVLWLFTIFFACSSKKETKSLSGLKEEVIQTEKEFAALAKKSGIRDAFYYFADEIAVIKRGNDTLITGKENIREFYQNPKFKNFDLSWAPDFADVSEDGTLGYTYGKYILKIKDENGDTSEYTGVFHTVWKRQENGSWKYVWD
jgi:ketosteroid isomerase-like protein